MYVTVGGEGNNGDTVETAAFEQYVGLNTNQSPEKHVFHGHRTADCGTEDIYEFGGSSHVTDRIGDLTGVVPDSSTPIRGLPNHPSPEDRAMTDAIPRGSPAVLALSALAVVALLVGIVGAVEDPSITADDPDDIHVQQADATQQFDLVLDAPDGQTDVTIDTGDLPDGADAVLLDAESDDLDVEIVADGENADEAVLRVEGPAEDATVTVTFSVNTTAVEEPTTDVTYGVEIADASDTASFDVAGPTDISAEADPAVRDRFGSYAIEFEAIGHVRNVERIEVAIDGANASDAENVRTQGSLPDPDETVTTEDGFAVEFDGGQGIRDGWSAAVAADGIDHPDTSETTVTVTFSLADGDEIVYEVPVEYEGPETFDGDVRVSSESTELAFEGQTVVAEGFAADETVELRDDDGDLEEELIASNVGEIEIETEGLEGLYSLNGVQFEVEAQTFDASFDEETVTTDDEVNLTIDSNRARFPVAVSSDDLDDDRLAALFGVDEEDLVDGAFVDEASSSEYTLDPGAVDPGTVTLTVAVPDTTAETNVTLTVVTPPDADVTFAETTPRAATGDIVPLTLDLEHTSAATVRIGDDEVGYNATVRIADEGDDGGVTLLFNTAEAGNGSAAFDAAGDAEIRSVDENTTLDPDDAIEDIPFRLEATPGDDTEVTDVGTLFLERGTIGGANPSVAPAGTSIDADELANESAISRPVAEGDVSVVEVEADGVYGYLLDDDDRLNSQHDLSLSIEETDPGVHTDPTVLDDEDEGVTVLPGPDHEYVLIAIETGEIDVPHGEYEVEFAVGEDNEYVGDVPSSATTSIELVERTVRIHEASTVVASNESEHIGGVTTMAPGTELTIRAESAGSAPFAFSNVTTVQPGGEFSAGFDFSDVPTGTTYDVTVDDHDVHVEGEVVDEAEAAAVTPTPSPTATPTPADESTPVETPTPTETPTPVETPTPMTDDEDDTEENTPGLGLAASLLALALVVLLASRRSSNEPRRT